MKKNIVIVSVVLSLVLVLVWIGRRSITSEKQTVNPPLASVRHDGEPNPVTMTSVAAAKSPSPKPAAPIALPAPSRLGRPATGGLQLARVDATGKTTIEAVDYYGGGAPGFLPVKEGEPLKVRFVWPYPDKLVTVTRMDGGTLAGERGLLLTVPVSATGQVEFDFQIGQEPGRYQLELMGRSGGVEAFGFWAGDPTGETMPASGIEFVDPPLRKQQAAAR